MSARKILTAHKGRRCKFPDCGRLLSIYNLEVNCHVHQNLLSGKRLWEEGRQVAEKEDHL